MTDDLVLTAAHFGTAMTAPEVPVGSPAPAAPSAAAAAVIGVSRPTDGERAQVLKPLPQAVAELEARSIREALALTGGNKVAASRLLGIARATLYEKLASLSD